MLGKKSVSSNVVNKFRSVVGLSGLVFVFIAVTFVNQKTVDESGFMEQSSMKSGRGVASVNQNFSSSDSFYNSSDSTWKKTLATHIADLPTLPEGKAARPASALEAFVFGELKGYYLMELKGEKVSEMFLKQKEADDAPKYKGDEISFLRKNREFWWLGFSDLEIKEQSSDKSIIHLLDSSKKVVGRASFAWDSSGHLVSLKIDQTF